MRTVRRCFLGGIAALAIGVALAGLLAQPVSAIVQTAQVLVATTPTLIWTAPAGSGRVLVRNPSASVSVWVGNSTVTTTTGFEIGPGAALGVMLANRGTLYGVVTAGTQVVYTLQGDNTQ